MIIVYILILGIWIWFKGFHHTKILIIVNCKKEKFHFKIYFSYSNHKLFMVMQLIHQSVFIFEFSLDESKLWIHESPIHGWQMTCKIMLIIIRAMELQTRNNNFKIVFKLNSSKYYLMCESTKLINCSTRLILLLW